MQQSSERSICEVSLRQQPARRHADGMEAGGRARGHAEQTGALAGQGAWSTACPCPEGHGREALSVWDHVERYGKVIA